MKRKDFARMARQLQSSTTNEALYHLLKTNRQQFELLCINPPYHIFRIPKRNGEFRTIEDPADELQKIQANLKKYLQALYHCYRTDAAYGYISRAGDEEEVRGIYGNAMKHISGEYLLNVDLEDFFHFVHWQEIFQSLSQQPFHLHDTVAKSISTISVFEGRLAMGAPTSPALSNIAAYSFDQDLLNYCRQENITYTRYVDDMSFSAPTPVTDRQFQQIHSVIVRYGYELNLKKLKTFGPGEVKEITGLQIRKGVISVPESFIQEVKTEIDHLKAWVLMQARLHPGRLPEAQLVKPMQKIKGALNFIASVHGTGHLPLLQLEEHLENAVQPPADYESLHWLEIGYETF